MMSSLFLNICLTYLIFPCYPIEAGDPLDIGPLTSDRNRSKTTTKPKSLDIYEVRRKTLADACTRMKSEGITYKESTNPGLYFRIDQEHNLAFCPLYKSATSMVLALLVQMSTTLFSQEEKEALMLDHDQLHKQCKTKLRLKNKSTDAFRWYAQRHLPFIFTFVRHPFDSKRRKVIKGSFPKFVDQLVLSKKHCLDAGTGCRMDGHWKPFYSSCRHCNRKYHLIGKVETFWTDWNHMCKVANVSGCLETAQEFGNKRMNSFSQNSRNYGENRTMKYFRQLSRKQRQELYELYYLDFEMFGYSAKEYLYE